MIDDIVSIVEEAGIDLKRIGDDVWRGHCPFHHDDRTPNFTVYEKTDSWFCFACGIGGNAVRFAQLFYNESYEEAKIRIYGDEVYSEIVEGLRKPESVIFDYKYIINKVISQIVFAKLSQIRNDEIKLIKFHEFLKEFDAKLKQADILDKENFNILLRDTQKTLQTFN